MTVGPHGAAAFGGRAGAATGPGGTIAGGSRAGIATGPGGTIAGGSRAGIATGPGGTIAGGGRAGIAAGSRGTIAGGRRGMVADGPYGAVAGGGRFVAGSGAYGRGIAGTRYVAAADLRGQGAYVRNNFGYYNSFTPAWYTSHPGAWFATGLVAGSVWDACTWSDCATYCGYPDDADAIYYNYGDNVTYQDGSVYYDGQPYATQAEYVDQASSIAAAGQDTSLADDQKWQPLGIFAMVKTEDEATSNDIFQLAINQGGIVRGNYYNAATDATTPVAGSLDRTTQRVAWTMDGQPDTVYDTGLFNLTQDETTMLVHFGKDHTEQYRLFRVPQQEQESQSQSN
jgi:hypothetical protein